MRDGENSLLYELGDIKGAIKSIKRLVSDVKLQKHLYINGLATAKQKSWNNKKTNYFFIC